MPFRSEKQRRFMYAKHPEIAEKWSAEYPNQGKLPKRASNKAGFRRNALLSKMKGY